MYLEQEIRAQQGEEDDSRTAEEDQLEHGEDEPGQQQTSDTVIMFSVKSNSSKLLPTLHDNKLRPAGESPGGR